MIAVPELVGRLGECIAGQTVGWGKLLNAASPQSRRTLCLGWSCHGLLLLCPWVVAKSAGEKKRHRKSHKKALTMSKSDSVYVKMAVEGNVRNLMEGGSRAWFQIGTVGKKERVLWLLLGAYS